jgi:hypothetical protein
MKFKTLMIIKAIVCLSLGVPILLSPDFVYSIFGASLSVGGAFAAREYGASLIGNMLLTWFARSAQESETRRAIILGMCAYNTLGFVITLFANLSGVLGPMGWMAFIIYLFFALGFGYFLYQDKKPVPVSS